MQGSACLGRTTLNSIITPQGSNSSSLTQCSEAGPSERLHLLISRISLSSAFSAVEALSRLTRFITLLYSIQKMKHHQVGVGQGNGVGGTLLQRPGTAPKRPASPNTQPMNKSDFGFGVLSSGPGGFGGSVKASKLFKIE